MKDEQLIIGIAFMIVLAVLLGMFFLTKDLVWLVFALLMVVGWLLDPDSPKPSFLDRWNAWLLKNRPRRLNVTEIDEVKEANDELSINE